MIQSYSAELMGLANPGRAFGRFFLLLISLKILTLSGIPPFSTNSFRFPPCFARWTQSFLFDRRACVDLPYIPVFHAASQHSWKYGIEAIAHVSKGNLKLTRSSQMFGP